jgi:hypothetical protein
MRWLLSGMIEHMLFLHGLFDFGGLTSKIKVLPNILLGSRLIAEGVIVESIVGLIKLIP